MKLRLILFYFSILLVSTFSISEAIEGIYKLPNTTTSRQEYKLFCQMKVGNNQDRLDSCIKTQKKVLDLNWFTDTQEEAENIQRYFSFCIGANRQRIKQGIDKNGRYYELWAWSPKATLDCLTKIEEVEKQKKGQGKSELKGEPGLGDYNLGPGSPQNPNSII